MPTLSLSLLRKTTMNLTDTVARFIFNSMRLTSIMSGRTNMREQQATVNDYIQVLHPQQRLTVTASLGVGDVLEPITESVYIFNGDREPMSFRDKLLVYTISSPSATHYLPMASTVGDVELPKTTIILVRYQADTIDFDLSKIMSVMCVRDHLGLMGLLAGFRLLGNIKDKM